MVGHNDSLVAHTFPYFPVKMDFVISIKKHSYQVISCTHPMGNDNGILMQSQGHLPKAQDAVNGG